MEVYDALVAHIQAVLEHRKALVATRTLLLNHLGGAIAKLPTEIREQLTTTGKIEARLRRLETIEPTSATTPAGAYRLAWLQDTIEHDRQARAAIRTLERQLDRLCVFESCPISIASGLVGRTLAASHNWMIDAEEVVAVDVVHQRCAALDVHKKSVVACLRSPDGKRGRAQEVRTFATFLNELEKLRDWLVAARVTAVTMESTGQFRKPVWYVLEDVDGWELKLVNARHVKQVPGRKTDVKDAAVRLVSRQNP